MNGYIKIAVLLVTAILLAAAYKAFAGSGEDSLPAYSQAGSSGVEVEEIQRVLKERGLFKGDITGYYGEQTRQAVTDFQKQQGLPRTGVADEATLKRLGITIGIVPDATEANINLLARMISAEGRGEP